MSSYLSELPTIDCHSHVSTELDGDDLRALRGSVVFAVTRSLAEGRAALARNDAGIVWGCGVHPRAERALKDFTPEDFMSTVGDAALIGEIGLDSRGDSDLQSRVFDAILIAIQPSPRLVSIHSTGRVAEVIDALTRYPARGMILHWFSGTQSETRRAFDLGCYFSVNAAMTDAQLKCLPMQRVLTETDFPLRSRRASVDRPGDTEEVERRLAPLWGLSPESVRVQIGRNLKTLCMNTGAIEILPEDEADTLLSL